MHLETFLYMLLQSEKVIPPHGVTVPDFRGIALQARKTAQANKWFTIPQQTLAVGLHDSGEGIPDYSFGWDIEKPQRVISVRTFDAQARPITNGEYARYMELNHISHIPASWVSVELNGHSQNGGSMNGNTNDHVNGASGNDICASDLFISKFSVRTIFGPVPLEWALDWPVMSSYDELAGYARWMNCRLPTFEEVKSIYKYSEHLKTANDSSQSPSTQDEVSSLTNGTSCETEKLELDYSRASPRCPDHQPVHIPSIDSMPVFVDLDGCNVGFKHWHPCPVTPYGDRLAGQGGLGGVWEWTSTPMMQHDGYKVMEIYPGYSADFFDGKHNIVLGGSWATHPRLAGRTTFVNWYQHNYPYAWVGARLVRDV
jgi:formylglycine-generating enzyme required for sulfatase activity